MNPALRQTRKATLWIAVFSLVLVWSAIKPHDRFTWFLEVAPAVIGFIVIAATWRRFPLTELVYGLILIHAVILMVGGHYTYAEVPAFDWIGDYFGWQRNHYDKLGHFAQGFVPAIIAREVLLRKTPLPRGGWLTFLVISVCLAISAFYELIEWLAALISGADAEAFLGIQGYEWDTQSDMGYALLGAIIALLTLARHHDHELAELLGRMPDATAATNGSGPGK